MTKKTKLPKSMMGVKIPKDLRKRGERLIDAANSPEGREMVAGVMGMAAAAMGAIAAKNAAKNAAGAQRAADAAPSPSPAPAPPNEPPHGVTREPDFQAIAETIGRNVEVALERVFGAKRA